MKSDWYLETHELCQDLASKHGVEMWQVAGIIVTLSAQKDWELNLQQTKEFLGRKRIHGMVSNHQLHLCREIMKGKDPLSLWDRYSHKYRNFYACIIDPFCPDSVCVDTHIIRWYLERHPHSSLHGLNFNRIFESPSRYKIIQDDIRKIARALGIIPMQHQAAIWLQRRANQ